MAEGREKIWDELDGVKLIKACPGGAKTQGPDKKSRDPSVPKGPAVC